MSVSRGHLVALACVAAAVAIGCGDNAAPTALSPISRGGTFANILPPYYTTAPYTYYCYKWDNYGASGPYICNNSDGQEIADLAQPQLNQYCKGAYTSQFCYFDEGIGAGYTTANPSGRSRRTQ